MNQIRNAKGPATDRGRVPDVAALMEFPERVREVPAEAIPQLIGAVELRAAALERLKAELWACLLGEQPNTAGPVSHSLRPAVRVEGGRRGTRLIASDASPRRNPVDRSNVDAIAPRNLMTVRQFCAAHPAFTEGSVRWLLFNRESNGLSVALVKKGRRLWIDVDAFFDWLE
jgi:hypothetical protein